MIGLSISLCIRDIAAGKIDIANVEKIFGGTATGLPAPTSVDALLRRYQTQYWHEHPIEAESIFRQLIAQGKIEEPRLKNDRHRPYLGNGHWVEREDAAPWIDELKRTVA